MKTLLFSSSLLLVLALGFLFSSCKKDEEAAPLTSLQLGKDTLFRKGATIKFSYSYSPKSSVMPDLRWESSDENVVAVKRDGTATAVNAGKATITLWVNDGTNLKSSRTVYVFEKPTISIQSVTDITYYSANFSLQYNMGGGDDLNSSCGIVWDTVPVLDTAKLVGRSRAATISTQQSIDMFDASKKYYIRAYAKTPFDITFSDSVILTTLPVPSDLMGNYMLNIPLAWGLVAKYEDWIYYNNFNDGYKMYKIKTDLTGKQKVSDATSVRSLSIIGSDIYFTANISSGYSRIMRVKLDGSKQFTYGDYSNFAYRTWGAALVQGSYIYPSNGYFRFSADGKEKIPNIGFNHYVNVYNNKLYFCMLRVNSSDSLYTINECNLDGSELKELYRGYNPYVFNGTYLGIYENAAYFREKKLFKKFDLESPSIIQILPIKPAYYNIANHTIFFSNSEDGNKLYKSDLGGNLITKLCDDSVDGISVIDDWLYYNNRSDKKLYRIKQDGTNRQLVD